MYYFLVHRYFEILVFFVLTILTSKKYTLSCFTMFYQPSSFVSNYILLAITHVNKLFGVHSNLRL